MSHRCTHKNKSAHIQQDIIQQDSPLLIPRDKSNRYNAVTKPLKFVGVLMCILLLCTLRMANFSFSIHTQMVRGGGGGGTKAIGNNIVQTYQCPSKSQPDAQKVGVLEDLYNATNSNTTSDVMHNNKLRTTKKELETIQYDGWDVTFLQNKERFKDWKQRYFSSLQSGDLLYESACGEGFNLALTLQVLHEYHNITDLVVYGNDYIPNSVEIVAPHVLKKLAPSGTKIGSLCQGDSSNLDYVPSDTFDLAYTGYIEPLQDPLKIVDDYDYGDEKAFYDLCDAIDMELDWANVTLITLDQEKQNEWFAKWVSELIRIVKPGKPIIIENIGLPACEDRDDFGGVAKSWWTSAIPKFDWDVDMASLHIEELTPDTKGEYGEYHVFMKKRE